MNVKESRDDQCNFMSVIDVAVDNVLEVLKNHEEEVKQLDEIALSLKVEIEIQKRNLHQLELEKAKLNDEITTQKLRNAAYQKEHINLRNGITVVQFQIEKIKESIVKVKENELKELENFEKTVDDITEKFRSSSDIYNRQILLEKMEKEKENFELLSKMLEEAKNSYKDFNTMKGLRAREDESESLTDCVLPDSEPYFLIQMTQTLNGIICEEKQDVTETHESKPV